MRLLPLLFKAVRKGDTQTFDLFAAPSGTHEEIKVRKDAVVQVYHVKNNAPQPVANQPNGAILPSNEGGATHAPRAGEKPMTQQDSIILDVPYARKDEAKAAGAKWNPAQKTWYFPATPGHSLPAQLQEFLPKLPNAGDMPKVVSITQAVAADVPAAPVTTAIYQDARRTLTVDDGILTATPVKGPVGTLALDGARISGIDNKIAAAIKASGQDPTDWYSLKSGMKTMALPPATRAVVEQAIAARAAAQAAKKQAAEAASAAFDATLEGQRAKLVRAEYNSYSPEHFPGSRPWLKHQQDEKALQAFDAAHPEIAAKIQAPKNPAPVVPQEKTPAPKQLTPANITRLAEHVSQEAMRQVGYPYDNAVSEAAWAADHLPQTASEFNKVCAALPYISRVKAAAILLKTAVVGARLGTHDNKGQPINPVHKKWKIDAPEAKPTHRCTKCGKPAVGMSNFGGWRCANHYDDAS